MAALQGVILAAGAGTRLRPLTYIRPKPLWPVGRRTLLRHAVERVRPYAAQCAANVHAHPSQMLRAMRRLGVHPSVEHPVALGTAGALGQLRPWLDGADVLLSNADAWYPPGPARRALDEFVAGWDGQRPRLLCVRDGGPGDFDDLRYVGTCLLPWESVKPLAPVPSGLYEVSWRALYPQGGLDLVVCDLPAVDCGTSRDLLSANVANVRRVRGQSGA